MSTTDAPDLKALRHARGTVWSLSADISDLIGKLRSIDDRLSAISDILDARISEREARE